jgi:hypothetical protein
MNVSLKKHLALLEKRPRDCTELIIDEWVHCHRHYDAMHVNICMYLDDVKIAIRDAMTGVDLDWGRGWRGS